MRVSVFHVRNTRIAAANLSGSAAGGFLRKATTMCDYSLMATPNRLGVSGDELVVHRFDAKSVGLSAASDVRRAAGFLVRLRKFFNPAYTAVVAVCIPPGAHLLVRNIPVKLQRECGFLEESEEAVFTQVSADAGAFRDAVRFQNGVVVLLQRLEEGQTVRILDLSSTDEAAMAPRSSQRVMI
jgi:hypothetical protein